MSSGSSGSGGLRLAVGNDYRHLPPHMRQLSRCRTQYKAHDWRLFAKVVAGNEDLVHKVEFVLHETFEPQRYAKVVPPFETRQQSYGGFVATVNVRFADGSRRTFSHELQLREGGAQKVYDLTVGEMREANFHPLPPRPFGVELELTTSARCSLEEVRRTLSLALPHEEVSHSTRDSLAGPREWRIVPDSSVACSRDEPACNTFELVTPKLITGNGLSLVNNAVRALNESLRCSVATNASTGFHVHVEVANPSLAQLKSLCCAWLKYEDALDLLVHSSRRADANRYCLSNRRSPSLAGRSNDQARDLVMACTSRAALYELLNPQGSRYFKLNLQNLASGRQPTVEVRMHQGTSEYARIGGWVRLMVHFVEHALGKPADDPAHPPAAFTEERTPMDKLQRLFQWVVKDRRLRDYWLAVARQGEASSSCKRARRCECVGEHTCDGHGDGACRPCA